MGKCQVNSALKDVLVKAYAQVNETKLKFKLRDLRTAALALAISRVDKALHLRGIFP